MNPEPLPQPAPVEKPFETGQVLTIVGAHFVHDTYTAFVPSLLPLIIEKLALSLTQAGTLAAVQQLPAILNPFIGYLADRVSLRYFVILTPAISATTISALGLANNFASLVVLLLLTGISVAAFHAPAPAMVGRISGIRIGKGMSWFMAGGELGRTLGPLVAVWAVSLWGLEGIYRLVVIGWLTSLLLVWQLRKVSGHSAPPANLRSVLPKLRTLYLPLFFSVFFRAFMWMALATYLPTYMNLKGAGLLMAGASLSILQFAGVIGALISGTLSDRLGRKPVLLAITVVATPLMLLFLKAQGWLLVPLLLLLGFATMAAGPIFLALVQDHFPQNRAVGNGIYLSMVFLINSVALFLLGVAGDAVGLDTAFLWSAWLFLLSIPFIIYLPVAAEA